ncbi:MAG: hypothetical protein EBU88_08760, partial [Acidobacteria bacterium]|nr:hypothetical protein [Acidobacteriota bacterium]
SSYLSQNDLRVHFGLGSVKRIDRLRVAWPSGRSEEFTGAVTDSMMVLVEGQGIASQRGQLK